MKTTYSLTLFLFLVVAQQAFTQCDIVNGDFSQVNCTNCAAFNPINIGVPISHVPNWVATHGTPDEQGGFNGSAHFVSMGGEEGLRANFDFVVGHTYTISFEIKVDDAQNSHSYYNTGRTFLRAMNNGPLAQWGGGNWIHTTPTLPVEQELVASVLSSDYPYWTENWETVQVQYTPSGAPAGGKYSQLWIYHDGLSSSWAAVKSVQITEEAPISSFHIQGNFLTNGVPTTQLHECDNIVLNGISSERETKHYIDVWKRPTNSGSQYTWAGAYYTSNGGWSNNSVGLIDLTNSTGVSFTSGWDYRIKLAVGNSCHGWVESTQDFSVVPGGTPPHPAFHMEKNYVGFPMQYFADCDEIWLVETGEANNGYNYNKWYLDLWERPMNTTQPFSWKARYTNANGGWVNGNLPARLDIKTAFGNQGNALVGGKEYKIQLAVANACSGWEATFGTFKVDFCALPITKSGKENTFDGYTLSVYPNPSEDYVKISTNIEFDQIKVVAIDGTVVGKYAETEIYFDQLEAGYYHIQLEKEGQVVMTERFFKK